LPTLTLPAPWDLLSIAVNLRSIDDQREFVVYGVSGAKVKIELLLLVATAIPKPH
jgi:hypothetical protein